MKVSYYDISSKEYGDLDEREFENSNEYKSLKHTDFCFFSIKEFHELHKKNAEKVYRIIIKNKASLIAEIYIGEKRKGLYMPYSSPFFYLNELKKLRDEEYLEIAKGIKKIKEILKVDNIQIMFSPRIYKADNDNIIGLFLEAGFKIKFYDINHYFDLKSEIIMDRSIKKDINLAQKYNLSFEKNSLKEAYAIIKQNREERGFPLRMSEEHLENIKKIEKSEIETFTVTNENGKILAAAIIFKIKQEKFQVVYWGNIKDESHKKPMAFLVKNLIDYYKTKAKILDIGPSSEEGKINIGLSQFKRNIGCQVCSKLTLEY